MSKDRDGKLGRATRRLLRRRTAAEELDTSVSRLKRLEREGKLTPRRIGGGRDVYYSVSDIEALASGEETER